MAAMGLAWDGDAGLVVIEAQAPVESTEEAEQTLLEDVEDGPDALRVLLEPRDARALHRPRPQARRRRAAAVPAVRAAAQSRRARLRPPQRLPPRHLAQSVTVPDDLTPALALSVGEQPGVSVDEALDAAARGRAVDRGPGRRRLERDVLLRRHAPTAARPPASTSRSPASGRCGTSPTARWPSARSRPTR